ncbi:hypothetical protein sos41_31340 [Alphaproteobacteria bacterium SO-S41]|nr:hypothetical protein sos41_31340 [Alphaproteobacteria bacterium SO-S41]
MTSTPFPIDPALTAIAIAFRNPELIADRVLPRVTPVSKRTFAWNQYPIGTLYTLPDDRVGRRGTPRQLSYEETRQTAEVEDHGLDDPIPQDDIDQAASQGAKSPVDKSVTFHSSLIELGREVRTAGLVFNTASYPSTNRVTLSGSDQWSDVTSDPIATIEAAINTPLMRPRKAVFGQLTWSAVRKHPKIVKAANKTSGDTGLVTKEAFAEIFELEEVIVGNAYVNTAKRGQAVTMSRTWGKHAAFLYQDPLADNDHGVTFGITVPYKTKIAGATPDGDIGLRGGQRVRVGESLKELIVSGDCGYYIQNATA